MENGYQIIEPSSLTTIFANPKHFDFAVSIYYWLIESLESELKEQLTGVEIDVIPVTYHGTYPALGIRYLENTPRDLGPLIEASVDRFLRDKTLLDFVEFIGKSEIPWTDVTKKILNGEGR